MLTPAEIASLVTATKGAIDLFDRIGGQIKSVLTNSPKELEGEEDRWKYKITGQSDSIEVKQDGRVLQVISADEMSENLSLNDLRLVETYEKKMEQYFRQWRAVYDYKDMSQDPLVNAKTDEQLMSLVGKMKNELLGILAFLEHMGVHLDDHYMHIRQLVQKA